MNIKIVFLNFFLFISLFIVAQPSNDDCLGAINLGTLPAPGVCGGGIQNGAIVSLASTNLNATPENPYLFMPGCGMAYPANSVWYSFVSPFLGFGVVINVSGATFANPNIALWHGTTCGALSGVSCTVGTAGNAILDVAGSMVAGDTYYIQISGNTGQSGTFNLNVNAYQDCSTCVNSATLTVNPTPVNGTYQPGQVVSFCFHINQYTQTAQNWLHGVQLAFGAGWDMASLNTFPPPRLLDNAGAWSYYPPGVTASFTGLSWPAGFYFDDSLNDLDPGDNFGDGTFGLGGIIITPGINDWNFCWNITVLNSSTSGQSLCMIVNTSSDGESGAWSSTACAGDSSINVCSSTANTSIGIHDVLNYNALVNIYPNPFTSQTTITFTEEQKNTSLIIMDILGNVILHSTIKNRQSTIDMSHFTNGIYFAEIKTEKEIIKKKLIKQ